MQALLGEMLGAIAVVAEEIRQSVISFRNDYAMRNRLIIRRA